MAPKELEKHMAQNGHVFKTYDLARAEMIRYAEELGTKDNHSKPMEVDASQETFVEGDVKTEESNTGELDASKGGGKGQNNDFCNYCKKPGHLKDQCWQNPSNFDQRYFRSKKKKYLKFSKGFEAFNICFQLWGRCLKVVLQTWEYFYLASICGRSEVLLFANPGSRTKL